jgi:hypothetical protein
MNHKWHRASAAILEAPLTADVRVNKMFVCITFFKLTFSPFTTSYYKYPCFGKVCIDDQ